MIERIILTTGGTGGHIFPALAVAEEIRARNPRAMILFMGGRYGQEADLAVKAGLDFVGLPVRGVMGRGLRGLFAAFGMGRGIAKALAVIRKTKPQLVVGFGGYAAFAGVMAARLSGLPTAIHEQNAFPGMSNRLLGKRVDRVFLSMPDTRGVFEADRCRLAGNPVRAGIVALYEERLRAAQTGDGTRSYYGGVDAPSPFDPAGRAANGKNGSGAAPGQAAATVSEAEPAHQAAPGETAPAPAGGAPGEAAADSRTRGPRLLVTGGSQGARAMNEGMLAVINDLLEAGVHIRHQTGQADYERVRAAYRELKAESVRVEPFIMDMPKAYAWADLIFCRAGASTLAEITAAGLPSLLAPFPQAAQDHQRHNALFMQEEGAAVMLEQRHFAADPGMLGRTLLGLLKDRQKLAAMAGAGLALAKPYAARDLVDGLEELLPEKKDGADA